MYITIPYLYQHYSCWFTTSRVWNIPNGVLFLEVYSDSAVVGFGVITLSCSGIFLEDTHRMLLSLIRSPCLPPTMIRGPSRSSAWPPVTICPNTPWVCASTEIILLLFIKFLPPRSEIINIRHVCYLRCDPTSGCLWQKSHNSQWKRSDQKASATGCVILLQCCHFS